jgi:hypothetical protein
MADQMDWLICNIPDEGLKIIQVLGHGIIRTIWNRLVGVMKATTITDGPMSC